MDEAFIFNIQRFSIHDGPGIRLNIFFKGCPLNCWWCHNPESQSSELEILEKTRIFNNKKISEKEVVGKSISLNELLAEIEKERVFFEESGGGVTFSGGEPLLQSEFLIKMLKLCQQNGIHTTIDTSGYASEKVFQKVAVNVDLFLFDLKIINNKDHIKYCGVPIEPILKNLIHLDKINRETIIRFPVIPTITDRSANIKDIIAFLNTLKNIKKIELLPYHRIAEGKYKKFKIPNNMTGINPPTQKEIQILKEEFRKNNLEIIN